MSFIFQGNEQAIIPVYIGTWAGRPAASAVSVGAQMIVTDVGVGGRSYWWGDGTNWRPVNGSVTLSEQHGTIAAPIATITGTIAGGFATFALPTIPVIPVGMLIIGARVVAGSIILKTGAGVTNGYAGPGLGHTQNTGGANSACPLGGFIGTGNGCSWGGPAYAQLVAAGTLQSPTYASSVVSASAGFGEWTGYNPANPLYLNVNCNNGLAAGDTLSLLSLTLALEF